MKTCRTTPRTYKTKAKNAQEAHEGIRPTSVSRTPEISRLTWKAISSNCIA